MGEVGYGWEERDSSNEREGSSTSIDLQPAAVAVIHAALGPELCEAERPLVLIRLATTNKPWGDFPDAAAWKAGAQATSNSSPTAGLAAGRTPAPDRKIPVPPFAWEPLPREGAAWSKQRGTTAVATTITKTPRTVTQQISTI